MPYELKPLSCDPAKLTGLRNSSSATGRTTTAGGEAPQCHRAAPGRIELGQRPGVRDQRPQARGDDRQRFDDPARGVLDSLGGTGRPDGALAAIERDFGSVDAWRTEFTAMGKAQAAAPAGPCGVEPAPQASRECWAADHAHNLAGATPLIALDMYEHS